MAKSQVRVVNNAKRFGAIKSSALDRALNRMADDIVNITKIRIPYRSGALQREIEHRKLGKLRHVVVVDKEYAAYQERGERRDGSHKVRNYTTPGTGRGFLKQASQQVVKNAINYLRQANNESKL